MAKRKNSTALFEVMRAAQQKSLERHGIAMRGGPAAPAAASEPASAPVPKAPSPTKPVTQAVPRSYAPPAGQTAVKPLGTPAIVTVTKKWLTSLLEKRAQPESEPTEPPSQALDPHDPTAGMTAQSLASRSTRPAEVSPSASRPAAAVSDPGQAFIEDDGADDDLPPLRAERSAPRKVLVPQPRSAAEPATSQLAIDRDRQEVTVKVRYQTIIIGLVAALSVIGLAYIVGKKAGSPTAKSPSTPEIRDGTAQPGVLNPKGDTGMANVSPNEGTPRLSPSPAAPAGEPVVRDAPLRDGLASRELGLNYCVIESYAPEQQQWALDVRDYLNSRNIPCTIEIGRPSLRTRAGDYIIVGTRGFTPGFGNTAPYEQYKAAIEQAGRAYPDKSRFNVPQIMMVKWVQE